MIRVIAVDDEQPALRGVAKVLEQVEDVQVAGLFDKPVACLEYALTVQEPIDLVLIDMDMPTMHGLELAGRLRECRPDMHIAFLTAYEEFAKDAFDVEALDYLLKPVMKDDIVRTIERVRKRGGRETAADAPPERGIAVHRMGPFSVMSETGVPIRFRNSKGKELLAYLHQHRGKPVSKSHIMEELWHGRDVERTLVNLHTTVYQLRKDLEACGIPDPIQQSKTAGGSYCLNWPVGFDDVVAFETEVERFRQSLSVVHALRAVQLYGGGYLTGSGYGWAAPMQAQLELSYAMMLEAIVNTYVRQQRYDIAMNPMRKWAELLPFSVRLHAKMIALLLLMNREEDAKDYHGLVREMLDPEDDLSELDWDRVSADPKASF
ncbi:response regulator [Paenibacillus flagellatus]|uniref:Response regulatory domain-containing protein n=1 Tax=Paenibacillus flagellatus TaxID=2211139 RepID=A0A2V5KVW2_9BACL|nr:response regulator [Paenibacillus flagellatus]PYI56337.1 hypothetical protein DLM86_04985 [Paenibacillus flagellatus]